MSVVRVGLVLRRVVVEQPSDLLQRNSPGKNLILAIASVLGCFCGEAALFGVELPWIVVNAAGDGFEEQGTGVRFDASGFNYDHDVSGRLLEDYWHTEWARVAEDFAEMRSLGARVVRVHLQFGRMMESAERARESELGQLRKLLVLAEETGLYLNLTGLGCYHKADVPPWYDALSEADRWAAQATFWTAIAGVCRDSSAVFCYDLMNEPVVGGEQAAKDWLGPAFAGKHFVQFVARETRGRRRTDVAAEWIGRMVKAIRDVDRRHLITVGLVDWSLEGPGLTSGFVPSAVGPLVDFLCVHVYPESQRLERAGEILQGFQTGRPLVVEETFALKCSGEELERVIRSSRGVSGWISFYWGVRIEEYQPEKSIGDALTADWLKRFSGLLREGGVVRGMVEHCLSHAAGRAAHTVDLSAWGQSVEGTAELPIGVFDSGIGGLTVLEAMLSADQFHNDTLQPGADGQLDFRNERFVYFGDQANMPYGNYPSAHRAGFLKELILKDAAFLLGRRYWASPQAMEPTFDKPPVKAIVIACNTATAWGLVEIRELTKALGIPVFVLGVVDSGAESLAERTSRDQQRTVAVLATVGTCSSGAWPRALERSLGQSGRRQAVVVQQGSRGIAGAIEGDPAFVSGPNAAAAAYGGPAVGRADAALEAELFPVYGFDPAGLSGRVEDPSTLRLNSVTNYIRYDVVTLLENYRRGGGKTPIDTLVLGCTHFPLVQAEILAEFQRVRLLEHSGERPWKDLVAEKLEVIDPASVVARDLFRRLAERRLFAREPGAAPVEQGTDLFFLSVAHPRCAEAKRTADGGLETGYKYGRQPGRLDVEDTIAVPMTWELLPASGAELIRRHLPGVAGRL